METYYVIDSDDMAEEASELVFGDLIEYADDNGLLDATFHGGVFARKVG